MSHKAEETKEKPPTQIQNGRYDDLLPLRLPQGGDPVGGVMVGLAECK